MWFLCCRKEWIQCTQSLYARARKRKVWEKGYLEVACHCLTDVACPQCLSVYPAPRLSQWENPHPVGGTRRVQPMTGSQKVFAAASIVLSCMGLHWNLTQVWAFVTPAFSFLLSPSAKDGDSEGTSQQATEEFVKPKPPISRLVSLSTYVCACVCLFVCLSVFVCLCVHECVRACVCMHFFPLSWAACPWLQMP